jgi:hypothetical protein
MVLRDLPDLIEDAAAEYGIGHRKLWGWALDAIATNVLGPIFPEGQSLDTEFNHGGMPWTLRKTVRRAHSAIDRYLPSRDLWAKSLRIDPREFDRWLKKVLRAHNIPVHPKRPAGRKATLRERVASFIDENYAPGAIPGSETVARDFEQKEGGRQRVSERTVRRALGRK